MYRISKGLDHGVDLAQVDEIKPAVNASEPGRYQADQIKRDPLPSGHTSRRCGVAIKKQDGPVVIEADPWSTPR
jgi:hypothetical protein